MMWAAKEKRAVLRLADTLAITVWLYPVTPLRLLPKLLEMLVAMYDHMLADLDSNEYF